MLLATLAVLGLFSLTGGGTLVQFTLATGLPPLLAMVALTIYVFGWRHRGLIPNLAFFTKDSLRLLMAFGTPLLLVQVAEMAIFSSAGPLISARLGPAAVPLYAVPWSLLMFVVNICDGIVRACLGGYVEAYARGDWFWIRGVVLRTRLISIGIIGMASLAFVALGPLLLRVWTRGKISPSIELVAWMAIYCFLMVCSNTNSVLLLGLGQPRLKAFCQILVAAIHVTGFFVLVPTFGLLAIPISGAAGYLCDILISYSFTAKFMRRHDSSGVTPPTLALAVGDGAGQ